MQPIKEEIQVQFSQCGSIFGAGKNEFTKGLEGLPKRVSRILAAVQQRTQLSKLSRARLDRRIGVYERLLKAIDSQMNSLQVRLGETGFKRKLLCALLALRNRTQSRLTAAKHFHLRSVAVGYSWPLSEDFKEQSISEGDNLFNSIYNRAGEVLEASNLLSIKVKTVRGEEYWHIADCDLKQSTTAKGH